MKSLLKILLPLVIIGAGVVLFMNLKASRQAPTAIEAPETQWAVTTERIEPRGIHPIAKLYGRLESPAEASLRAAVEAEVEAVRVREGDFAERGELLVELDDGDLRLALDQREAEIRELDARVRSEQLRFEADRAALEDEKALLEIARRNLARARRLASNQAGSEVGVDDALQVIRTRSLAVVQRQLNVDDHPARLAQLQASIARARAARAQVESDLERTSVRSPFDARVTGVSVSAGERVRVGDAMLELFDVGAVEIRAQVPERHLAKVRESLDGDEPVDGIFLLEGRSYPIRLVRLAGTIRQRQGGLDGFFQFTGEQPPRIETGRVASLHVRMPVVEDGISLPLAALYGADIAYAVVDGRLSPRRVEYVGEHDAPTGETRAVVVSDELEPGDEVITTQIPAAVDGLKVTVQEQ